MATIASAQEKYARKTGPGSPGVRTWRQVQPQAVVNYREAMQDFLGGPPLQSIVQNYDNGYTAGQYRGGDANKWASRYREKMMGR